MTRTPGFYLDRFDYFYRNNFCDEWAIAENRYYNGNIKV